MDRIIIFIVGAGASAISEIFWRGESRRYIFLWGGLGMLLLRRVVLRFPGGSRVLLCLVGAVLLTVLRLTLFLLQRLPGRSEGRATGETLSFSYGLYRFLLIAPAYTIIEYLETFFRM